MLVDLASTIWKEMIQVAEEIKRGYRKVYDDNGRLLSKTKVEEKAPFQPHRAFEFKKEEEDE